MSIREWLEKNRSKYTDRSLWIKDCAKSTGCSIYSVRNIAAKIWKPKKQDRKSLLDKVNGKCMKRRDFLSKYDENTIIREAIDKGLSTLKGSNPDDDDILENVEFRMNRCECTHAVGFQAIAQEPQYRRHQFKQGQKIFWTTERTKKWALENVSRAREV